MTKATDQRTEFVNTIAQRDTRIAKLEENLRLEKQSATTWLHMVWKRNGDIDRKEAALRDALHALETAQGLWVTDKAQFRHWASATTAYHVEPKEEGDFLTAMDGTYWRQSFPKQIAKIKAALGEN